jgi:hypothetical protein
MNWQIDFYSDKEGNEPVNDFICAQSPSAQAEILHVIGLLQEFALTLGLPYVKKIGKSGIRELRIHHGSDYYPYFLLRIYRTQVRFTTRVLEKNYENA